MSLEWIVLYTVHFTAFCLRGPFFPGHGVVCCYICDGHQLQDEYVTVTRRERSLTSRPTRDYVHTHVQEARSVQTKRSSHAQNPSILLSVGTESCSRGVQTQVP